MDDFEFSVDISDRDWQCFFTQCEECNVLPPSLAGLEESGMSDMDELGARFSKNVQKSDLNAVSLREDDEPAGSPREGPAEELCPGRLTSGGMESVLSGSEEDIHLQSVNMFFEQMKSSSDSKKRAQLGQVGAIQKSSVQGEKRGGVQLPRCTDHTLPKNILCSGSARGGAAGSKTTGAVSTSRHTYSVRTEESSSESSTSLYIRHPYLKTQLHIETSSENTEHEPVIRTDRSTPHSNIMYNVNHPTHRRTADVNIHPDPVMSMRWTEDKSIQVSQSDTDSNPRQFSKQSSPSTSVKRKRRKKRRLSAEPVGNLFPCERLYDSEDELFTWRRAIDPCFCNWSGLKHQHLKCEFMPPLGHYTLSSSLPAQVRVKENQLSPEHHQRQSVLTQAHFDPSSLTRIWPSTDYEVKQDSIRYNIETNGSTADDMELTKLNEDTKVSATHLETFAPSDTYRNEVRSITHSIFPNAESNGQRLAMGQSDRGSTAKSVMREEDETNKVSQRQRETEPPHLRSHTVENMTPPPRKTATSISTVTDLLDCKTRRQDSQSSYTASEEASATLHNLSPVTSDLFVDVQKSRCCKDDAKLHNVPPKHEMTEVCETEKQQEAVEAIESENMDQTSELRELSENQSRSTSVSTLSSCNTPESEPLPIENIAQTLECSALIQNGSSSQEENVQIVMMDGKVEPISQNEVKHLDEKVEEPCWDQVEVAMTNSKSEELDEPGVKPDHPVFTMSSFWKEMEKVTINDILGLRMESKASSSFLPTLQEVDDPDCFTLSDLGCCTQVEEKKNSQDKDARSTIQRPADRSLCVNSNATSRGVQWEDESVPKSLTPENVYNDKISSIPVVTPGVSRGLRRMSKNVSVQNLHTLESELFCCNRNSQSMLKQLNQNVRDDIGYLPEDPPPKRKPRPSSLIENFRLSISDIYGYFFNEKEPNSSFESPTEDILDNFIHGDSVPENYDHFFSEFDTDTFFYTEESKSELVPIFSCSRSSKSKVKLRDGYDYFLVSSSDNSSGESDEEDRPERAPIRVVSRFSRKPSSKDIITDAYENFYTDRDLKQDFFKTTFSLRNFNFTGSNKSTMMSTSAIKAVSPLNQNTRAYNMRPMPITLLGNQDLMFPDSVLCNLDDQFITRLQQPLIYENLHTAVANPNLDAPLLPIKQSDMCLICIAFASWVLKTANPQAGDAWKAVLLANVSALSAIRYLRKYVKGDTAAGEKKPNLKA